MDRFLRCLCDEDYSALIIEGTTSETVLRETWLTILGEYQELRGSYKSSREFMLTKEIKRLRSHLFIVEHCLQLLERHLSEKCIQSLRELGYRITKDQASSLGKLKPVLNTIYQKVKPKYIYLQQKMKELGELSEKTLERPSRETFENILINIEQIQQTSYHFETLTVSKFCALQKKLEQKIHHLKTVKRGTR